MHALPLFALYHTELNRPGNASRRGRWSPETKALMYYDHSCFCVTNESLSCIFKVKILSIIIYPLSVSPFFLQKLYNTQLSYADIGLI